MKKQPKTKKMTKAKAKTISRSVKRTSTLLRSDHFKIASHKDTGKLIHYRQTSHLVLVILLIVVGIFLYFAKRYDDQQTVLGSSTVTITAVVPEKISVTSQTNGAQTVVANASPNVSLAEEPIEITGSNPIIKTTSLSDYKFWLDATIPIYYIIFALTLGFWAGDLFDRKFGSKKRAIRSSN